MRIEFQIKYGFQMIYKNEILLHLHKITPYHSLHISHWKPLTLINIIIVLGTTLFPDDDVFFAKPKLYVMTVTNLKYRLLLGTKLFIV